MKSFATNGIFVQQKCSLIRNYLKNHHHRHHCHHRWQPNAKMFLVHNVISNKVSFFFCFLITKNPEVTTFHWMTTTTIHTTKIISKWKLWMSFCSFCNFALHWWRKAHPRSEYQFWLNNHKSIIQTSTKTTIQNSSSSFNQSLNTYWNIFEHWTMNDFIIIYFVAFHITHSIPIKPLTRSNIDFQFWTFIYFQTSFIQNSDINHKSSDENFLLRVFYTCMCMYTGTMFQMKNET